MNKLTFNEIYEQALSENTVPASNTQQSGNVVKDIQELLNKHQNSPQFFQELDKQLKAVQQQAKNAQQQQQKTQQAAPQQNQQQAPQQNQQQKPQPQAQQGQQNSQQPQQQAQQGQQNNNQRKI